MKVIQVISIDEMSQQLGSTKKTLNIQDVRKGCEIIDLPYKGGGVIWVDVAPTSEPTLSEHDKPKLVDAIRSQLDNQKNYMVVYERLIKKHSNESYFKIIIIEGNDFVSLKKAFKAKNLAAFL